MKYTQCKDCAFYKEWKLSSNQDGICKRKSVTVTRTSYCKPKKVEE